MSRVRTFSTTVHALLALTLALGAVWVEGAHARPRKQPLSAKDGRPLADKPKYDKKYVIEHFLTELGLNEDIYVGGHELIYDMKARLTSPRGRRSIFLKANAGAGKTALVNALAREMKGTYRFYALDVTKLRAGTGLQGEIEDRYKAVMAAFADSEDEILFLDEIHSIQGEGTLKDVLKVPLQSSKMAVIAASTPDELRDSKLEEDKAFMSRFLPIDIPDADFNKIVSVLDGLRDAGVEAQFEARTASDVPEAIARAVLEIFPNESPIRMAEDIYYGILAERKTAREQGPREVQRLLERQQQINLKLKRLREDIPYTQILDDEGKEPIDTPETEAIRIKITRGQLEYDQVSDEIRQIRMAHDAATAPQQLLEMRAEVIKLNGKRGLTEEERNRRFRLQNYLIPDLIQRVKDSKSVGRDIRINKYDVARWVGRKRGIPSELISASPSQRIRRLIRELAKVEGHKEAKKMIVEAVRLSITEMKPLMGFAGLFLLDGASGMGKTELIERLAIGLFGSLDALLTIEFATFGANAESRIMGAGPSYINSEKGGIFEPIRKNPSMVINGDEFDKISKAVLELLHHPFDKGKMRDAMQRYIGFMSAFFVGSSNYTARYAIYKDQTTDNRAIEQDLNLTPGSLEELPPGRERDARVLTLCMLRGNVSPSMLTRLRNRILMDALKPGAAERITRRMAKAYAKTISARTDWDLTIDNKVGEFIGRQVFTWEGGGRDFGDGIAKFLGGPLSRLVSQVDVLSQKGVREGQRPFSLDAGTKVHVKIVDAPTEAEPRRKEIQFFVDSPHLTKKYEGEGDDKILLPTTKYTVVDRDPGPPPRLVQNPTKGEKPILVYGTGPAPAEDEPVLHDFTSELPETRDDATPDHQPADAHVIEGTEVNCDLLLGGTEGQR